MDNQNKKEIKTRKGLRLFVKSAIYTLVAMALIAIGYFGTAYLLGGF